MASRVQTVVASIMLACAIPLGCVASEQPSDDDEDGTRPTGGAYPSGGAYVTGGANPQGGASQGGTNPQGGANPQGGNAAVGGTQGGTGAEPQGGSGGASGGTDPMGGSAGVPPTCTPACRTDQVCNGTACACPTGFIECGGTCVASDGMNCGVCGRMCTGTQVCSNGACSTSGCANNFTQCGASCFDLTSHKNNCGMCGRACPADQDCLSSMCRCRTGTASCNGGACQDVYSDEANCGACGMRCPTGATCTMGVCVCPNMGMACSGTCYDIANDEQHCGNCTTTCSGNNQCLFGGCVDPASVNCGGSNTGRTCARNAAITLGKYWINNNWWGVAQSNNGSANCSATSNFQSIAQRCQQGDLVGWSTDWNWAGTGSVMTFASLVFGWQYDDFRIDNTGLPIQLSANRAVNCGWSFTVTGSGTMNVAYDMWLHTTNTPTYNTAPSEEIMVWLHRSGGAGPVGSQQATVTIGGASWDLYRGTTVQPVYSYVRTQNASTAVLNMSAFAADLISRGWVTNSRYLTSVQAGTEIFTGSGSVTTNGFYCRLQ